MENYKILVLHHLNCCTNRPRVGKIFNERVPCRVVSHCILIETNNGLVLIDTGIGLDDMIDPARLGFMHKVNRPRLDENETAIRQIQKLGFNSEDVQHIIMTHLDLDHAGGLPDFPHAKIHVLQSEYEAAMNPHGFKERGRYRKAHWAHLPNWTLYSEDYSELWFEFNAIKKLRGLPPGIVLIRLPGHSRGHCGVAIKTSNGWLLHAGDTFYYHKQMDENPITTFGVKMFQRFAHFDHKQALQTKVKLRTIVLENSKLKVICSHDTFKFEELSQTKVL